MKLHILLCLHNGRINKFILNLKVVNFLSWYFMNLEGIAVLDIEHKVDSNNMQQKVQIHSTKLFYKTNI